MNFGSFTRLFPPAYTPSSLVHRTFRFINFHSGDEGLQTYNISPAKLCALQVIGTVANSTVNQLYESVRVHCIDLYVDPSPDGNIGTGRIEFSGTIGGLLGPNKAKSCQSSGMTVNGHCRLVPDPNTQAAGWFNGDVTATAAQSSLFTIAINSSGTTNATKNLFIIDLKLSLRLTTDTRLNAASAVTGLTTVLLGSFYNLALDNNAGGTLSVGNDWTPSQTLTTTT